MDWKILGLAACLFASQSTSQTSTSPAPAIGPEMVVEVARFNVNGNWYDFYGSHEHDNILLLPTELPDGSVRIKVGPRSEFGTHLEFVFSHDSQGHTHVTAMGLWSSDVHARGYPSSGHVTDLEGRVLIQTDDWGPGKTLNAMFAIHGTARSGASLYLGCFSILRK